MLLQNKIAVIYGTGGVLVLLLASRAQAQIVGEPRVVHLWPGVAPSSEHWTQVERTIEDTPIGTVIMNVVTPTITAYLPDRAHATGTGVIIAPGGAFVALAIDREGNDVARWLQQRGIAAFLLKYRVVEKVGQGIPQMDYDTAARYGIADGIQALKVVRQHAAEWGVDPGKIGFLGFSAGGMVASAAMLQDSAALRPAFVGLIYGAPFGAIPRIPAHLPPIFMAWARDDPMALDFITRFAAALHSAGIQPDEHVYASGGHGFGVQHQGTESDKWIEDFVHWLGTQGMVK